MANENIKRYLDYDGLVYLINKFNGVIDTKIEELVDNTGGFPIIDADITQVDSVYTTTENLNELITPGQYIVDSSKIQYEDDTFIKTLYWLLSVDKVVYDNNESIVQTYYPLSYLTYNWYNIPVGGLLQRFYEGNNTWTDLQVAAPGDIDPNKFVTNETFTTTLNDYVSNETLSTTLDDYVDKSSYIPNILKNGTPQAGDTKDNSLQWYQTSNAITDTNSTDYNNICAPSYNDFTELTGPNNNSMVIRSFWNDNFFHDIWMSPNSDYIFHRNIYQTIINGTATLEAKPWKILLDNENCGNYVKNVIKESVNTNEIIIPKLLPDANAIIGNNLLTLDTVLDRYIRLYVSENDEDMTDLSIVFTNKTSKSDSLSIGYYNDEAEKNYRIASFYTTNHTGRPQGRFDLDGELCVHANDTSYLLFEHINYGENIPQCGPRENNSGGTFTVKSFEQNYIIDNFYIKNNNYNSDNNIFKDPNNYANLVSIYSEGSSFYNYLTANNGLTIYEDFKCNPYANFNDSIGINNSKHIELISIPQSKLPSDSTASDADLGTDAGDIIFYKNVGKIYTNPDNTPLDAWPDFASGDPAGEFTEHYGPMEIARIYTTYTSDNKCILSVQKANGLVDEGNPQNTYINGEIIDSSNFNQYLNQISNIEFRPSVGSNNGGYIDFHYDGSTEDFTSRIIEEAEGTITISASTLSVLGKINAADGVFETSDETLKDFQDSIQVNFEQLKEIPKAYFTFKDDKTGETKIGTSAQKVKEFYPELVTENNEGILSVDYAKLSMVALKAVDILDDRITKLEKLVEQLLENK